MDETDSAITHTTLKLAGEGYRILTAEGLLSAVNWVDWVDEDGEKVEATLEDGSQLTGPGALTVAAIWHEDIAALTPADLAAAPPLDGAVRQDAG